MTFDEAIEKIESITDELNIRQEIINDIVSVVEGLRKEYAPMVAMTEMQMKQMMSFKEVNAGFSTFMYKQGLGQVPAFSDFITTQRENELLQAWLHPEIIKVVDE